MFFASISMANATESNISGEKNTSVDSVSDISTDSDVKSNLNSNINSKNNSSSTGLNSQNSNKNSSNTIISGKILNCHNDDPFKGATIYIKSLSGETLATAISDANGNYRASFYSLDSKFFVLATYPGHVYPSETISVSQTGDTRYGVANLRFGNLVLTKGSTDILTYGSSVSAGPNSTLIQIRITNNAATTATNVWANLTWGSGATTIDIGSGESLSKFIGNIAPGQTVQIFFLIAVSSSVASGDSRNYTISVSGDNTGSPIDTINGTIVATLGVSQNRNQINSMTVSNTNPKVGDFITVTVVSSTASGNFQWVNLPIEFNPAVLQLINTTTTFGNGQNTTNVTQNGTGQTNFVTVWVFQVIGAGDANLRPWIFDYGGGSPHYNSVPSPSITINATPVADLAITKTANTTNPTIGDTVTFTITVRNNGPSNATGVNVNDILNTTMMQFLSASSGAYDPTTGLWTIGNLNVNATVTLTITVRILVTGEIINVANVSGNEEDPNLANNWASVILSANDPIADLAVSKSVDNTAPVNGQTIVFTIVVINNGPNTAVNSRLTDVLPNGLILLGSNPSQGTFNPSTGLWSIGDLLNGQRVTLTLTCKVNGTGSITNVANVSSDTIDPILPNNNDSVTINAQPSVDLGVVKTVDNPTPLVGQNVTFTIAVTNYGPNDATGVTVTDLLRGTGLIFINANIPYDPAGQPGSYDPTRGIWNIGNLAVGDTVYLTITVRVNASGTITNVATVQGNEPDMNPSNDLSTATINGPQNADLTVKKTADKTTYNNGDIVTFTITVTNNGPNTAINASATDLFPNGLIYLSSNPSQGSYDPSTGIWSIGDLANLDTVTLTITARINQTGTISNIVVVQSDTTDNNPFNNLAIATINVNPSADLKVVKTTNATNVTVGSLVNFTIVVYNLGPDTATGVTLVDYLPTGLIWVSDTSGGSYNPATGIWIIGTIAPGGFVTLNIVCMVNSTVSIMNLAMVYGNENDPDLSNNHDNVFINGVPVADLSVVKSADKTTYNNGDIITFTITVTNNGPNAAVNTIANDLIPAGVIFISAIVPGGTTYDPTTGIWTIGTLNPFVQATLVITVRANQTGLITNYVNVGSDTYDPITSNNNNSVTVMINPTVDLAINKTANATNVTIDDYINFTITVTNNGPNNATGVYVIESLPIGVIFISSSDSVNYDHITGIWIIGNLNVGDIRTLNITVQVIRSSLTMNNTVRVDSNEYDSNPSNNLATVIITSNSAADLAVTKTVDNSKPNNGATVTFTIIVSNNGPDNATGVFVSDPLPNGLTFVSASNGGTYNSTTGLITWDIPYLAVGTSITLQIVVNVTRSGNITNIVQVGSDLYDPNLDNNIANVTIDSQKSADLMVVKTVDNPSPPDGTDITFTITVTNNGPDNATNVLVLDQLPSGLTFVSASNGGTYNSTTGLITWDIGGLNNGDFIILTIVATVNTPGIQINNVTVNATENDPDPTNNKGSATIHGTDVADLVVHKFLSSNNPKNGDTVTFYIIVTNNGPDAAIGAWLNDTLPGNMGYLNSTPSQGSYDPSTGIWTIGDLASGQTVMMSITVTLNGFGLFNNTVTVNSTTPELDYSNNNYTLLFNVSKAVDINVTKTVDVSKVQKGDTITFTITVTNSGPDNATNVVVIDKLHTGLVWVSDNSGGNYTPSTGIWIIGDLDAGDSRTLTITVNVSVSNTVIVNTASGSCYENETNYANNNGTAVVTVDPLPSELPADVAIRKTVDNQNPYVGEKVNFTITVTNRGPNMAIDVIALDKLPAGMTYVSSNPSRGTYNPVTGQWIIGNLSVRETVTLVIEVIVTKVGVLDNHASVNATTPDPILGNNNNSVSINVLPKGDVGVKKTVDNSAPSHGDIIKFTITVTNYGASDAENVLVTDQIPQGLKFVKYDTRYGYYVAASGHWFIGYLAVGQSVTLDIWVEVIVENANIINEATKTQSTLDTDISNDHSYARLTVSPKVPKLEVSKKANATEVSVGDYIKYTITIKNVGGKIAIGVYALDKLPSSLQFIRASASIGSYNPKTGRWAVGDLAPGETATLTIVAKALKAGKIINRVEVGFDGSDPIFDESVVNVKPKDNNRTNGTNGTAPDGVAGMKKTAVPLIALVVLLISIVGIVIRKNKI